MTSNSFGRFCPYLCGYENTVDAGKAGYQMIVCPKCGKPWVLEVVYIPYLTARKVEGIDLLQSRSEPADVEEALEQELSEETAQAVREWADVKYVIKENYDPYHMLCATCGKRYYPPHMVTKDICWKCFENSKKRRGNTTNAEVTL